MLTSYCKETKQPHKKFKVDRFFFFLGGGYISRRYGPVGVHILPYDLITNIILVNLSTAKRLKT